MTTLLPLAGDELGEQPTARAIKEHLYSLQKKAGSGPKTPSKATSGVPKTPSSSVKRKFVETKGDDQESEPEMDGEKLFDRRTSLHRNSKTKTKKRVLDPSHDSDDSDTFIEVMRKSKLGSSVRGKQNIDREQDSNGSSLIAEDDDDTPSRKKSRKSIDYDSDSGSMWDPLEMLG